MRSPYYLVFDLETRKLSQDFPGTKDEQWAAIKRGEGGISALAIYDSRTKRTYLYDDHTIAEAASHLECAEAIVGYNSKEFDLPIIEGLAGRKLRIQRHYDLLVMIWDALRQRGHVRFKGNKLDEVGLRTLGRGKIEKSSNAPKLATDGKWASLFSYCMDDVDLTRELFEYIRSEGGIIGFDGKFLPLDVPTWLRIAPSRDIE